jgi:hypothetical protein
MQAKYERKVALSEPMQSGSDFYAQTHNGSITIKGRDVKDCNVIATIVGHAMTEEKARELAERTQVRLERQGDKLVTIIEKPSPLVNASITVSLDVTLPKSTNMELVTHNGEVEISNISGDINATTYNGQVVTREVSGNAKLETHNGSIECHDISGNIKLKTYNGEVHTRYSQSAPSVCEISIISHNGGIELVAPLNLSAAVKVSTHNGSIKTDLPIKVTGELSKHKIEGTIGAGDGKLVSVQAVLVKSSAVFINDGAGIPSR